MSNPNKQRGTQYETDSLRYFRSMGIEAERIVLAGSKDEGDLVLKIGGEPYVLELKNRRQMDLAGWVDESMGEAINYANARSIEIPYFGVMHKRRMQPIARSFVTIPTHEWLRQIRPPF